MKCGIDIVDIPRVALLVQRHEHASLSRIWTCNEMQESTTTKNVLKIESLAAKFACKEAVAKALGTGFGGKGVQPAEIEVLRNSFGEPIVTLSGKTAQYFAECGFISISVSLTHANSVAAAICIIE